MNFSPRGGSGPGADEQSSGDRGRADESPVAPGAFTIGSTMRHVLRMTGAGSVGLIAVFFVDFLSLLYISRLGDPNLTAAVGYASQVAFFIISVNIGLSIAVGALVSRALGAGDRPRARRLAASGLIHVGLTSFLLSVTIWPFATPILHLFGARGAALASGATYLRMILPATVFLGIGMAFASILRCVGDAKRAMYVTLGGAIVTAVLDPIFIFGLHLGLHGAAIVLVTSRFALLAVGWRGAVRVHDLVAPLRWRAALDDLGPMMTIAVPAVLTNIATPIANIYAMRVFSQFGQETVAAFAIMDRVTPVVFGVLFALSGSVGPIMGQNYGAALMGRVREVLTNCLLISTAYVMAVTVVLWFAAPLVVELFSAKGETAHLLYFFCRCAGVLWLFLGGIFVANAAYNNLGAPFLSAVFNWGRATLGTVPFVTIGAARYGAQGGYVGLILGAACFGVFAVAGAYLVVGRLTRRLEPEGGAMTARLERG